MANYTEHYQLHQWEPEDPFLRTDFNEDLEKIDHILSGFPEIIVGTYVGDGSHNRTIDLGFMPRLLYVCNEIGTTFSSTNYSLDYHGGLVFPDLPAVANDVIYLCATESGFQVIYQEDQVYGTNQTYYYTTNLKSVRFRYFAVK
ncbi:hypothetical protein B5E56_13095 [Flavonifractor sp. An112]|uniref:hypothetical protein n=1 Tax=Flavonifractor sp. An112 TaxID=1965544 RepID=UPI000B39C225|nr:hypothetical protein [Flavonifractor sp. An112]OUQ56408.1 hypothetical protein B5E56_13095 [Flavonifractor sp. An112]